jgi:hypothetical protein
MLDSDPDPDEINADLQPWLIHSILVKIDIVFLLTPTISYCRSKENILWSLGPLNVTQRTDKVLYI